MVLLFLAKVFASLTEHFVLSLKAEHRPINMGYAYFIISHISKHLSFVRANNHLLFLVFNYLSITDTILVKELQDCVFILLIAICTKTNSVFVCRLLCSF